MSSAERPDGSAVDPGDILQEVGGLAADHGWTEAASFVAAVGAEAEPVGVLVTADTDSTELVEWLKDQTPSAMKVRPMADVTADPGAALCHERVIVVGRCGVALGPDDTEALSHLAVRPHFTVMLVFIDADRLDTVEALERVDRGIRRTAAWAFGDYDAGSVGGPPTVLWAKGAGLAPVGERLEADRKAVAAWFDSPVGNEGLDLARAHRAVDLAAGAKDREAALAAREDEQANPMAAALRKTRTQMVDLRSEVETRLDNEKNLLADELDGSLRQVYEEMARGVDSLLSSDNRGAELERYYSEQLNSWFRDGERTIERSLRSRSRRIETLVEDDMYDWELVNQVVRPPQGYYPDLFSDATGASPARLLGAIDRSEPLAGKKVAQGRNGLRENAWRLGLGVSAATVGQLIMGVPGAFVLGAAGVGTAEVVNRSQRTEADRAVLGEVKDHLRRSVNEFRIQISRGLDEEADVTREAVSRHFAQIKTELDREIQAVQAPPEGGPDVAEGTEDDGGARLEELRRLLRRPTA